MKPLMNSTKLLDPKHNTAAPCKSQNVHFFTALSPFLPYIFTCSWIATMFLLILLEFFPHPLIFVSDTVCARDTICAETVCT
jgi:hypothetical protein